MEAVAEKPKAVAQRTPYFNITSEFTKDAEEIYFSPFKKQSFLVQKRDRQGNLIFVKDKSGEEIPVSELHQFNPTAQRVQEGYLCFYKVTKDTPKDIKDALKSMKSIQTLDQYQQTKNPDEYVAVRENMELKKQLADVRGEAENLINEILETKEPDALKALQKRLKKLKAG